MRPARSEADVPGFPRRSDTGVARRPGLPFRTAVASIVGVHPPARDREPPNVWPTQQLVRYRFCEWPHLRRATKHHRLLIRTQSESCQANPRNPDLKLRAHRETDQHKGSRLLTDRHGVTPETEPRQSEASRYAA